MNTLYQWCNKCGDERVFDYKTVTCKTCGEKPKSYVEPKQKKK